MSRRGHCRLPRDNDDVLARARPTLPYFLPSTRNGRKDKQRRDDRIESPLDELLSLFLSLSLVLDGIFFARSEIKIVRVHFPLEQYSLGMFENSKRYRVPLTDEDKR